MVKHLRIYWDGCNTGRRSHFPLHSDMRLSCRFQWIAVYILISSTATLTDFLSWKRSFHPIGQPCHPDIWDKYPCLAHYNIGLRDPESWNLYDLSKRPHPLAQWHIVTPQKNFTFSSPVVKSSNIHSHSTEATCWEVNVDIYGCKWEDQLGHPGVVGG